MCFVTRCILPIYLLQRNCIEFALKAKPVRRYIPKNKFQYKIWWFVTSQPFEYAIFVLIMLNTVSLAMKFRGEPKAYTQALDILNLLFTAVFALEFVLKIMAFRFKVWFQTTFIISVDLHCQVLDGILLSDNWQKIYR